MSTIHTAIVFVGSDLNKVSEARAAIMEHFAQPPRVSSIVSTLPPGAFLGPLRDGDLSTFHSFLVSPNGVTGPIADACTDAIVRIAPLFDLQCHQVTIEQP